MAALFGWGNGRLTLDGPARGWFSTAARVYAPHRASSFGRPRAGMAGLGKNSVSHAIPFFVASA